MFRTYDGNGGLYIVLVRGQRESGPWLLFWNFPQCHNVLVERVVILERLTPL